MFLSRMQLNPQRRGTRVLRANPQAMHAAVLSAFPPRSESRPLWRLDEGDAQLDLLVLSEGRPSFEHLQEQAGWTAQCTWETRDYEPLLARLQTGQEYAFRLAANPTHLHTGDDGVKRRLAHSTVSRQAQWLFERESALGVRFLEPATEDLLWSSSHEGAAGAVRERSDDAEAAEVTATSRIRVSHRRTLNFDRKGSRVTIAQARFEGAVQVVDAERLRQVLVAGVGRAKGYGCGLLTLAPMRRGG